MVFIYFGNVSIQAHSENKLKNFKRGSTDTKISNNQIEKKSKEEKIFKKINNLLLLLKENQKTTEKTEVEEFIWEINVLIEKFKPLIQNAYYAIRLMFLTMVFVLSVLYISSGSYNPFIYFRF